MTLNVLGEVTCLVFVLSMTVRTDLLVLLQDVFDGPVLLSRALTLSTASSFTVTRLTALLQQNDWSALDCSYYDCLISKYVQKQLFLTTANRVSFFKQEKQNFPLVASQM